MSFSEYSDEEHEAKATAVLAALGRFVVAFERVCAAMRGCIHITFAREGLKNQGLSQIMVNGKAVAGLREMLGGVYAELRDQDDEDKACVTKLLKRVESLAEHRNSLLHAEWHMNYDYEGATDEFTALALKHRASPTQGASFIPIGVAEESLQKLIREATEVQVLMNRLCVCMHQNGFKVSEHLARPL